MKKTNRYIVFLILLFWTLAGLSGCGIQGKAAAEESIEDTAEENGKESKDEEEFTETVLSLSEGEIRSIWMEKDILYVFVASDNKEKPYGIYEVRDGSILEETPYSEIMEQWLGTEMKKSPASSYEYEARLGRNQVVYLLGRDKEGNVKRCYWMEKTFYTDVPFYKKYGGMTFSNIEISNKGEIYLEKTSGGLIIPYYDFYERIGFGVSTEKRRMVLGERRAYQLAAGWIYVWDIPSGANMDKIRCNSLTNGSTEVFIDKDDSIYLMGSRGLAYLPCDGSIWEILVDVNEEGFSGSAFDLKQLWIYEENLYLAGRDMETGQWQILRRKIPGKAVKK